MLKIIFLFSSSLTTIPLSLSVISDDNGRTYTAAIVDQIDGKEYKRTINIVCSSGCENPSSLTEDFDDEPLGIFRTSDAHNIIYVTSTAGSSYKIRAYSLNEKVISNVFEKSSLSPPVIISTNQSEKIIISSHYPEKSLKVRNEIYQSNGGVFSKK